jgi:hypothetical protein
VNFSLLPKSSAAKNTPRKFSFLSHFRKEKGAWGVFVSLKITGDKFIDKKLNL